MSMMTIPQNLCLTQLEEQAKHVNAAMGVKSGGWTLEVPLRIYSELNQRGSHWKRTNRFKKQRATVAFALMARWGIHFRPVLPVTVVLTRLGRGMLDEHDGLPSGCKAIVDEVAAWLGVDDADPRVTWRYAQERSKTYACRIQIEVRTG